MRNAGINQFQYLFVALTYVKHNIDCHVLDIDHFEVVVAHFQSVDFDHVVEHHSFGLLVFRVTLICPQRLVGHAEDETFQLIVVHLQQLSDGVGFFVFVFDYLVVLGVGHKHLGVEDELLGLLSFSADLIILAPFSLLGI